MSVDPTTGSDVDGDGDVRCWCCGAGNAPDRMVQLGNHPEVHLCLGCAHFVHQQAWQIEDAGNSRRTGRVRDGVRSLRALVIRRDWQHNRFIGGVLRRLDKYLP